MNTTGIIICLTGFVFILGAIVIYLINQLDKIKEQLFQLRNKSNNDFEYFWGRQTKYQAVSLYKNLVKFGWDARHFTLNVNNKKKS